VIAEGKFGPTELVFFVLVSREAGFGNCNNLDKCLNFDPSVVLTDSTVV
jgi:hypothetical protein